MNARPLFCAVNFRRCVRWASAPLPERWHLTYNAAAREVRLCYNFGTLFRVQ